MEDEKKAARALRDGLERDRCEEKTAATGEEGSYLFDQETFDRVILDLLLPERNGLEVGKQSFGKKWGRPCGEGGKMTFR